MGRNSFILYSDTMQNIDMLSDEKAGQLIKCICARGRGDPLPYQFVSGSAEAMLFSVISQQIERNWAKYDEICVKRSENARKRWSKMRKDANASKCMQVDASKGDNDNDTGNGCDTGTEINPRAPTRLQVEAEYMESCRRHGTQPRPGFIERFLTYKHQDWKADMDKWVSEDKATGKGRMSPNRFINYQQSGTDWDAIADQIMKAQEMNPHRIRSWIS